MCLSTTCDQSLAHHSAMLTWLPLRKSGLKKTPGIKKHTTSRDISECTFQDLRRDRPSRSSPSKSAKQRQPPALPAGDQDRAEVGAAWMYTLGQSHQTAVYSIV